METADYDQKLARLAENRRRWARLDLGRKLDMLDGVIERTASTAEQIVAASSQVKQVPLDSPVEGEEWFSGPLPVMRYLRFLRQTLQSLHRRGAASIDPETLRQHPTTGQAIVDVLPTDNWDRAIYPGFTAEVWMQPDVPPDSLQDNVAGFYRQSRPDGAVELIPTVANVSSIPPLDALSKLYAEGHVCLLLLHPANDFLVPQLREIFGQFIDEGFVDVAIGRADAGAYLVDHQDVEHIHLTGSDQTHDAIVYGLGDEADQRRRHDRPRRDDIQMTSALGNISPIIVAPGPWSPQDLDYHAENIATQIVANAGFNCNDAQVLITPKGWEQRGELLDGVRGYLDEIPPRPAYYPGAYDRFDLFTEAYEQTELFGRRTEELLPWGLIPDVDSAAVDSPCFKTETFCGLLCETSLDAPDVGYYLARAVDFCNEHLWGNLCASLYIHPDVAQPTSQDVEAALTDLRYGTVMLNHWPALSYGLGVTPWGAYPENSYRDIQSGIGFTHNALLFDRPQKTVMRGPFRTRFHPPWFATHKRAHKIGPRVVELERDPSVGPLLQLLWQELRG